MGNIMAKIWTDERFRNLDYESQSLFVFFISLDNRVPGLITGCPPSWAHEAGKPVADYEKGLRGLTAVGLVHYDAEALLAQIPSGPVYNSPGNPNVLRGWYRRWSSLPRVDARLRHVEFIERSVWFTHDGQPKKMAEKSKKSWTDVWAATFGGESPQFTNVRNQTELFARGERLPVTGPRNDLKPFETVSNDYTHDVVTLKPFESNEIRVSDPYPEEKEKLLKRSRGPDKPAHEVQSLVDQYVGLFEAEYGNPPQPPHPLALTWAAERIQTVGLDECSERLKRLFVEVDWLEGVKTFRTFERNFDKLAQAPKRKNKPENVRVGRYEPAGKTYVTREVKL